MKKLNRRSKLIIDDDPYSSSKYSQEQRTFVLRRLYFVQYVQFAFVTFSFCFSWVQRKHHQHHLTATLSSSPRLSWSSCLLALHKCCGLLLLDKGFLSRETNVLFCHLFFSICCHNDVQPCEFFFYSCKITIKD